MGQCCFNNRTHAALYENWSSQPPKLSTSSTTQTSPAVTNLWHHGHNCNCSKLLSLEQSLSLYVLLKYAKHSFALFYKQSERKRFRLASLTFNSMSVSADCLVHSCSLWWKYRNQLIAKLERRRCAAFFFLPLLKSQVFSKVIFSFNWLSYPAKLLKDIT